MGGGTDNDKAKREHDREVKVTTRHSTLNPQIRNAQIRMTSGAVIEHSARDTPHKTRKGGATADEARVSRQGTTTHKSGSMQWERPTCLLTSQAVVEPSSTYKPTS